MAEGEPSGEGSPFSMFRSPYSVFRSPYYEEDGGVSWGMARRGVVAYPPVVRAWIDVYGMSEHVPRTKMGL